MILFRSARESDGDAIYRLAEQSGAGMTTFPKNKKLLEQRLSWSCDSYKKGITKPSNEYYLFVLEDQKSKEIVGTSAIEAKIGYEAPFYSYKISKHSQICPSLNIRSEYQLLNLVNDNQGRSEICTLFLEPQYRKNRNGLLLSKARFLFMAQYPERFSPMIIAELRGISDEHGQSPFWNQVGSHFFHMPFSEADKLTLATNKQFIADLMPRNPLYIKLLSPEAQAVIGKPHPSTVPAMTILLREGFRYNDYIDIFDGGPTLEVPLPEIKTLKSSRLMIINNLSDEVSSNKYLLANAELDFRATIDQVLFNPTEDHCIISKNTAALLKVTIGDKLRIAPIQ